MSIVSLIIKAWLEWVSDGDSVEIKMLNWRVMNENAWRCFVFFAAAWQNKDVYNIVVSSSYNSVMQTKI